MDEDVEAVYEKIGKEEYILLMNADETPRPHALGGLT